jgi:hypothetical protein
LGRRSGRAASSARHRVLAEDTSFAIKCYCLINLTFTRTAVDPVQRSCRSSPGGEFPRPRRKSGVKTRSGPNRRNGAPVVRVCSVDAWLAWPTKISSSLAPTPGSVSTSRLQPDPVVSHIGYVEPWGSPNLGAESQPSRYEPDVSLRPSTKFESGPPSGGAERLQLPEKWRIRRSLSPGFVDRDCVPREAPTRVRRGGRPNGPAF